jgi:hypothetical protein
VNAEVLVALGSRHGKVFKVFVSLELGHGSTFGKVTISELTISRSLRPDKSCSDQNEGLRLGRDQLLGRRLSKKLNDKFSFI